MMIATVETERTIVTTVTAAEAIGEKMTETKRDMTNTIREIETEMITTSRRVGETTADIVAVAVMTVTADDIMIAMEDIAATGRLTSNCILMAGILMSSHLARLIWIERLGMFKSQVERFSRPLVAVNGTIVMPVLA